MTRLSSQQIAMAGLAAIALAWGCGGGVAAERVDSLEAQLQELRANVTQASEGSGDASGALAERVAAIESNTAGSLSKMGEMLEVLQREVTRLAGESAAAAKAPEAGPATAGNGVWSSVSALLGVAVDGVKVEGDKISVSRAWLAHEVEMMAIKGKGPKLADSKDGVALRGLRPKTLPTMLGLKNGDVVTAVGDKPVKSAADVIVALRAVEGDSVAVKLMRRKKETVLSYSLVD